jgi:hypothetical protein
MDDPADDAPVILAFLTAHIRGQVRPDRFPLFIRQPE